MDDNPSVNPLGFVFLLGDVFRDCMYWDKTPLNAPAFGRISLELFKHLRANPSSFFVWKGGG